MYKELTFLKQIGEGSFGRVYMARWRETTVAVKVLAGHVCDDGGMASPKQIVVQLSPTPISVHAGAAPADRRSSGR
jgi:serine/threonine protein kinase